jgi:hypothetical protein
MAIMYGMIHILDDVLPLWLSKGAFDADKLHKGGLKGRTFYFDFAPRSGFSYTLPQQPHPFLSTFTINSRYDRSPSLASMLRN